MTKLKFGSIHADSLTMEEALERITLLASQGKGGYVVTPNIDHIVIAERNPALRAAYADSSLSLADGKPLIWMSKIAGIPLPEKISGSDLVRPLLRRAAERSLPVYFLGSAPGVGQRAADILRDEIPGLTVVGVDSPPLGFEADAETENEIYARMLSAGPALALIALGAPKQELLMHRWRSRGCPVVMLGIGASLDFIAGAVKRSPRWMSDIGLEWLYRLSQDPKRLAKRYLVQDLGIIPIFARMMSVPKRDRSFDISGTGETL